jgi:copper chaperone CopZ
VEGILNKVPGVESATVDFGSQTATVECSSAVSADVITEAVAKSGQYTVAVKN